MTDTLFVSNVNYRTLLGSTITTSTMTVSSITVSTITASTIFSATGNTALGNNVSYPNRFVEVGSDVANSMYLDFHSSDAALPDYSTRIQSLGGATLGTGNLNMYASTIGLMPTVGVGIGTTVPTAIFSVLEAPVNGDVSRKNMFLGFRNATGGVQNAVSMALALGPNVNTVNPYGSLDIKLNGLPVAGNTYGAIPDITVMSIIGNGNVGIGTTVPNAALHVNGGIISNGSVGIGTTIPGENLTIYSSSAPSFTIRSSIPGYLQVGLATGLGQYSSSSVSGDSIIRATSGNLMLQTGSGNAGIYINSSNNVGIGTTNPTATLHVNGGIRATNGFYSYTTTFSYYSGNPDWNTQSIFGDPSAWPWGGNTFLVTIRGPTSFNGVAVRASFIVFHSRNTATTDDYGQVTTLSSAYVSYGISNYALRFTFNSPSAQVVTINIMVLN